MNTTRADGPVHDPRAFKFEPRDVVLLPKQFGKTSTALLSAEGVALQDPRFLAAQLQHFIANAAREAMLAEGHTLKSYVDQLVDVPGMTYERLVRIQRGETLMQIADLMAWAQRFDAVRSLLMSTAPWPVGAGTADRALTLSRLPGDWANGEDGRL